MRERWRNQFIQRDNSSLYVGRRRVASSEFSFCFFVINIPKLCKSTWKENSLPCFHAQWRGAGAALYHQWLSLAKSEREHRKEKVLSSFRSGESYRWGHQQEKSNALHHHRWEWGKSFLLVLSVLLRYQSRGHRWHPICSRNEIIYWWSFHLSRFFFK